MCNFTYSSDYTPIITDVSPGNASTASLINIMGKNFGNNMSSINALVGSQYCDPIGLSQMDSNGTQTFSCQLIGLNLGNQPIQLNIQGIYLFQNILQLINHLNEKILRNKNKGLGNSQNAQNLYVTGLPSVDLIEPASGSIYGGTLITVQGNGFDKTTIVKLGSVLCTIKSVSINTLACVTGSNNGVSGTVALQIKLAFSNEIIFL